MSEPARSWPPRGGGEDREFPTTSWPPSTARARDREDREVVASWPRRVDREDEDGPRVQVSKPRGRDDLAVPGDDDEWAGESPLPVFLTWIQEWRFVRDTSTTADHIDYAISGAYSVRPDGPWRMANLIFAYTIGLVGALLCDAVKWSFFMRLPRALVAIPTLLALLWALNHIPVTAWAVPDGWDISTWWQPDPATTFNVPVEAPLGEG